MFLLDGFELHLGQQPIDISPVCQRLLAFLAMHIRPMPRPYVAGNLWLDAPECRAMASLRSTLWRLSDGHESLILATNGHLRLSPGTSVDLRDAVALARRVLRCGGVLDADEVALLVQAEEVLPGWYEDWVLAEQERFRQLRLHALEILAERLAHSGRFGEAADCALTAVATEPLRETAHRALIRVHLIEGNRAEAIRQVRVYRRLVERELGVGPLDALEDLLNSVR